MKLRSDVTSSSIAVGYARASTNKQKYTVSAQHDEFGRWSAHNVIPVVEIHDDPDVSTDHAPHAREGFRRVFEAIKATKADFLLVVDRDRVARNVLHMALLEDELSKLDPPCRIITTTQNPHDQGDEDDLELVNGINDLLAQREKKRIKKRTLRGVAKAREAGKYPGPKSWDTFKRGQLTIQLVKLLRKSGFSNQAIVRYCAAHTILSPHRGVITMAHVRSCLGSDYQEADLDRTVAAITADVLSTAYYQSRFVPGDMVDRMRVHA
jgi:DNA invertase Pin-like site-specific DNA recombinase